MTWRVLKDRDEGPSIASVMAEVIRTLMTREQRARASLSRRVLVEVDQRLVRFVSDSGVERVEQIGGVR